MWPAIRKQQYLRRWLMSDNDMFEKVQRLYIEKYQSKSTIPIPRKKFLEAGWDEEMFLRYYTECSELYFFQLTFPWMFKGSHSEEIIDIWKSSNQELRSNMYNKKSKESRGSTVYQSVESQEQNLFWMRLNIFCQLINEYVGMNINTKGITSLRTTSSINYANWPFQRERNFVDSIPIFMPFEEYMSCVETTIGEQLVNPNVEYEIKYKATPEWYSRSYEELQSMYTVALKKLEETKNTFLQFEDYYSPDGRKQLNDLFYNFCIAKGDVDDLVDRLEKLEDGEFSYISDTLLIYKGETKCFREHHSIEPVTADVLARRGSKASININYCTNCHKYFISEHEFFHYRDLYGIVCKLKVDRASSGFAHVPMAEYSILRLYGYNVGKDDDYSDEERQNLLRILIENNYVSKPEIIKYLDMFITMNSGKDNMEDSISKWESDLEFVRGFGIDTQSKVNIGEIKYAYP